MQHQLKEEWGIKKRPDFFFFFSKVSFLSAEFVFLCGE